MKTLAAAMTLSFLLGACASDESSSPTVGASNSAQSTEQEPASSAEVSDSEDSAASDGSESDGDVEVDKGLLNVEITFPAEFMEFFGQGLDPKETLSEIDVVDYESFELLPGGAVKVKMSRVQYGRLVSEQEIRLRGFADALGSVGEEGVVGVSYNRSLTEFDVTINRAVADPSATFWIRLGLGIQYALYSLIAGEGVEGDPALIRFVDSATGEVFETSEDVQ